MTIGAEYDKANKSWKPVETVFTGAVVVVGGSGGSGKDGGAGGSVTGAIFDNEAYIRTLPGVAPSEAEWINATPTAEGENKIINTPARNVGIGGNYEGEEIIFNDVTIESSAYGNVELYSSLDGSLEVDGTVYGRILLSPGFFIAGDLRIDGPSDGVFISVWEYNEETDSYEQVLTPFTEEFYAEYVGGEVTINGTPSDGPDAWQRWPWRQQSRHRWKLGQVLFFR